jgi:hypothetical protein
MLIEIAIGLSSSIAFADCVMEDILEYVNELGLKLLFTAKYGDDFFLLHDEDDTELLYYFNNYDNNMEFTCEYESDEKLTFLDVKIIRVEDKWYRKPTSSDTLLSYRSQHTQQKKST